MVVATPNSNDREGRVVNEASNEGLLLGTGHSKKSDSIDQGDILGEVIQDLLSRSNCAKFAVQACQVDPVDVAG